MGRLAGAYSTEWLHFECIAGALQMGDGIQGAIVYHARADGRVNWPKLVKLFFFFNCRLGAMHSRYKACLAVVYGGAGAYAGCPALAPQQAVPTCPC